LSAVEKETGFLGRVDMPDHRHHMLAAAPHHEEHPYFRVPMPNPEIRVTSPSTVAGGSDDEDGYYPTSGRRRR
jgi:hypothetical protein